jgi:hypothetical protein
VTSTNATVTTSPFLSGRVAMMESSVVPEVKAIRAEGSQEWVR